MFLYGKMVGNKLYDVPGCPVAEKKRQAALHKEAAWDGSLANQSLDAWGNCVYAYLSFLVTEHC